MNITKKQLKEVRAIFMEEQKLRERINRFEQELENSNR